LKKPVLFSIGAESPAIRCNLFVVTAFQIGHPDSIETSFTHNPSAGSGWQQQKVFSLLSGLNGKAPAEVNGVDANAHFPFFTIQTFSIL
jgi:hypothetical protein